MNYLYYIKTYLINQLAKIAHYFFSNDSNNESYISDENIPLIVLNNFSTLQKSSMKTKTFIDSNINKSKHIKWFDQAVPVNTGVSVKTLVKTETPITTLTGLIQWWKNNSQCWFNSVPETNALITSLFHDFFKQPHHEISSMYENKLGLILLYDQVVRHIYRQYPEIVQYYHTEAISISELILREKWDILYSPVERIFILMPFLHSCKESMLIKAIEKVLIYRQDKDDPVYQKFYKESLISFGQIKNKKLLQIRTFPYQEKIFDASVLDTKSCSLGLASTYHNLNQHLKTDSKLFKSFKKNADSIPRDRRNKLLLTISISGGVDSMVCSYLAYLYAKTRTDTILRAVHINYDNRDSAQQESVLVVIWCHLLKIDLWVRKIDEIERCRDENINHIIRFGLYQKVGGHVILGNNRDDSFENILGISEVREENGISILRPLLSIPKSDIYQYAHANKIPFVNNYSPFVKNFDKNILSGLLEIIDNTKIVYTTSDVQPFRIGKGDGFKLIASVDDKNIYLTDYWKVILSKITRKWKLPMVSNKSIKIFCEKIKKKLKNDKSINYIFLSEYLEAQQLQDGEGIFYYFIHQPQDK